jgi:predicted TIM-barrel fold metal-dependent hydrolase
MPEYRLIDADCHILEPPHIWDTWLPEKYKSEAPQLVKDEEGGDAWQFGQGGGLMHIGLVATPGMKYEDMKWKGYGYDDIRKGCFDGKARLEDMDTDGVDAQFIFPSQRTMYHFMGNQDHDFHLAGVQAYNNYMAQEFCAADSERLFFLAQMPNLGVDAMIAEMKRCKDMGCHGVIITTWPEGGDDLTEASDPFFAAAAEMNMPVNIHVVIRKSTHGKAIQKTTIGGMACKGAMMFLPTMMEIIFSGVLDRVPDVKILGIEVDAGWIPWCFEAVDNYYWRNRAHENVQLKQIPSYYFKENFAVSFMQDYTAIRNRYAIGIENMLWSTDYPHHGNDWPYSRKVLAEMMHGVPDHEYYLMTCGNMVRLYGLNQTWTPPSV